MKKLSVLALAAVMFAVSCKESKTDTATTTEVQEVASQQGENFIVNSESSTIKWTGYHKGGLNPRFGIALTTGELSAENGNLIAGTLTSEVQSIKTDLASVDPKTTEGKTAADLDAHLKSADFFDAEKYPTVKFDITKVEDLAADAPKSNVEGANKLVSGNLTIKDKTVNVTFPAKVEVTDSQISLVSKFTINRQDWGLAYGTEGDPKDWMISKDVDMDLNIVAKK
ncbi:YceI family protein [Chryseobacterium koreense]